MIIPTHIRNPQNALMIRTEISLFLLFLFSALPFIANGQEKSLIIKGVVVDSLTNQLIADVSVKMLKENKILEQDKSSKDGLFLLRSSDSNRFQLEFTHLNYNVKKVIIASPGLAANIDLGFVYLSPKINLLGMANVVGSQAIIKKKIDGIEFNVQNDPDKNIYNMLDMLQKVPLINVDGQDKISLKGKSNFKLLINGKPSALLSGDPGAALKMMPSKDILKIEVITSPSAKYDADGIGGLINIITKKKSDSGYDIYIGASYNFPYGPLGSFNTNVKKDKLQVSVLATTFFQQTPYNSVNKTIDFTNRDHVEQQGEQRYTGNSSMFRGQLLYELDSLNMLSLSGSWKRDRFDMTSRLINHQSNLTDYIVLQNGSPFWETGDIDLNYQKGFQKNPKKFLNFSYKFSSSSNAVKDDFSYQGNDWPAISQRNEFGFKENSVQVDYESQSKNILTESGGKFISRNSNSIYGYGQENQNEFTFDYNVFNLYQTIGYEKGNWSYKGGVRMDLMFFPKMNNNFEDKFNLLPSVAIQKSFMDYHSLGATYNVRIQRANISEMSPFTDRSNPKFISSGNPRLEPTKVHNFNFTYSYINKLSLITDFGYSHTNNAIQQVYTSLADSLIDITYQNIGKERSYDVNANIGYSFKKVRLTFNGRLSYIKMEGLYKNFPLSNEGYEGNMSLSMSVPLSSTFRTNLSARYTGAQLFLQGRSNDYLGTSVSFTKQLLDKRLSLFVSVNNPFCKYFTRKRYFSVPEFSSASFNRQNYRTFVLSASYSFGSSNLKTKKIKKKVENSDQNTFEIKPLK